MTDVTASQGQESVELPAADEQLLRELTERARVGGLQLTGEGGLLGKLTRMVIEGALEGELDGQAGQVTRLVVKRGGRILGLGRHSAFRVKSTVTDPATARSVAEAACALPPMPSGAMSCPADSGLTYRLLFSISRRELAPVSVDATGCGEVKGLGQTRWTARSPGFWRTLRKAEAE